jgi:polyphosphate glucokinase
MKTTSVLSFMRPKPAGLDQSGMRAPLAKVLVVDVGGSHVKLLVTGENEPRKLASGPTLTPRRMISEIKRIASDWKHDAVAIGYPGPVLNGLLVAEPWNLGKGWVGFDFAAAFGCPVKIVNDATMQAIGSYRSGKMLFLGLGTGLGSAMIVDGIVEPMELGHLPYKDGTFEDYVGQRGLERNGKKQWRRDVADVVGHLMAALQPSETVIGGGNVRLLKELPPGCRAGNNAHAFQGGFRLWDTPEPASSRSININGRGHKREKSTGIQMLHETLSQRRAGKIATRKAKHSDQLAPQIK